MATHKVRARIASQQLERTTSTYKSYLRPRLLRRSRHLDHNHFYRMVDSRTR